MLLQPTGSRPVQKSHLGEGIQRKLSIHSTTMIQVQESLKCAGLDFEALTLKSARKPIFKSQI